MELKGRLVKLVLKKETLSVSHHIFKIIGLENHQVIGTYYMTKPLANEKHTIIQSEWIRCDDLTDEIYDDIRHIIHDFTLTLEVQRIYAQVWAGDEEHINRLINSGFSHYNSYGRLNELTNQLETEHVYELKIKNF